MSIEQGRVVQAARWAALACAAIAIAAPTVASGAVQRRATTTIDPQALGSATARCGPGRVALAAGFAAPGFDPSAGSPVARSASMPAGGRAVKTTAFNFNSSDPGTLESYAYCGRRARPPEVRSASVEIAPGEFGTATAECPARSRAIAGGFGGGRTVITLVSKRAGSRGWSVGAFNIDEPGTGAAAPLSAYAYCKAPGPRIVTETKQATVSDGVRTLDVGCRHGRRVVSGGFDGNLTRTGGQINAAGALTSKRTAQGRGWTTSSISVAEPSQATITAYAYCK